MGAAGGAAVGAAVAGGRGVAVEPGASDGSPGSESPAPGVDLADVGVKLTPVVKLESAIAMAQRDGDDALYIAGREGRVNAVRRGEPEVVLDISDRVTAGGEQGLLGITFSPDGRFLYVDYTDLEGDTQIDEFAMGVERADASTGRHVLTIDQPFGNHNGGNVVFGPDGFLYIGMGDGGSQGDPNGNGQNLKALLAKILRIDPVRQGEAPYSVPADNPFVGRDDARPEVWDYGMRNPWRWSFDRETEDLWIGDVGGGDREEVDFEPAGSGGGRNYGWNLMEGTFQHADTVPQDLVPPVFEYQTGGGGTCAITGGYVYRGTAIPDLVGAYLYSDFCVGDIRAFRLEAGKAVGETSLGIQSGALASFGQDQDGELYVLCLCGDVFRIDPA